MVSLSSCGDDDDNSPGLSNATIAGTWNVTAYTSDSDITFGGEVTNATSSISNSTLTITFSETGTWTSEGSYTQTVVSDGMTETEVIDDIGTGIYTTTNGRLQLQGLDAGDEADLEIPFDFNVTEFDADRIMVLDGNAMESIMDPIFGLTFDVDIDIDMTLER